MNIQETFTKWYVERGGSQNSVNTYKTAMRKTHFKNGKGIFDISDYADFCRLVQENGLGTYFQDRGGDYDRMDILFDYDEGIQKDDLKGAVKAYLEFLDENSAHTMVTATDLQHFKAMLEYFVHILRVNKDLEKIIDGEAKSGKGYNNEKIRNDYVAFSDYSNGKTMDVTIQAGHTITKKACYIHWSGTDCNVVAVWNDDKSDVTALQLYKYGTKTEFSSPYSLQDLGLNDGLEPNEIIKDFLQKYVQLLTTMQQVWMFQGNPKYYDVVGSVDALDDITWAVNQSPKIIKGGDKVYIWLSGSDGGIIASGTILSDPAIHNPVSNDPFARGDVLNNEPYLAVDIHLDRKFTENIIQRSLLLADERTKKLQILTYPGATNFNVTKDQDVVIESIIDGSYVRVSAVDEPDAGVVNKRRYWIYSPGEQARLWDEFAADGIMAIGWDELGDLTEYKSKEEIKNALKEEYDSEKSYKDDGLAIWQFTNELAAGDIVFAKKGMHQIIGRGVVESEYIFDNTRDGYKHIHKVKWTNNGTWEHTKHQAVMKTLTDITQYTDYVEWLESLVLGEDVLDVIDDEPEIVYPDYSNDDFLNEVFLSSERYSVLCGLLERKKNVILQGAPGVGKTYAAQRLAFSIMGKKDTSRVKIVQFHQSYSYEDFIMGYRPDGDGFHLAEGAFYRFCKVAENDDERPYFFIIDEINRGNLSKIFGELLMLIEGDKRGRSNSLRLLYKDEQFFVPANVHIIGMMNTADRSLAMIDYALRRRFAFFDMEPAFLSDGFNARQEIIDNPKYDALITVVKSLNRAIAEDSSLGLGFRIGHSYFYTFDVVDDEWLSSVVEYEILPLLQEYWFDEPSNVESWTSQLRRAISG